MFFLTHYLCQINFFHAGQREKKSFFHTEFIFFTLELLSFFHAAASSVKKNDSSVKKSDSSVKKVAPA
jgi:D-alanyl-lipoteichoic acid acyltransferase DltB (MBOAT superfamily)